MTISLSVDDSGRVIIDFGPDGMLFNPAATLTVSGTQSNGDTVVLYVWDPVLSQWMQLDTSVTVGVNGQFTTTVSHFSLYGLGGGILK
ncbi:MAG: hypothetical protein HY709_09180 [Candidatus Latescibacteria bacterium]|nr:hypothetical protein [Candidatus Latescibacterota bacterium]